MLRVRHINANAAACAEIKLQMALEFEFLFCKTGYSLVWRIVAYFIVSEQRNELKGIDFTINR